MTRISHRIRRQVLRLHTSSSPEAFALRQNLRDHWEELLMPVMEQVFDSVAPDDQVVHIPRLQVDLKIRSIDELRSVLPGQLYEALLQDARLQAVLLNRTQKTELKPGTTARAGATQSTEGTRKIGLEQSRIEQLLHYLETGNLPWTMAGGENEPVSRLREVCREALETLASVVRRGQADAAFCFRLLQLLSSSDAQALIQQVAPELVGFPDTAHGREGDERPETAREMCFRGLSAVLKSDGAGARGHLRLEVAATLLASVGGYGSSIDLSELYRLLKSVLSKEEWSSLQPGVIALTSPVEAHMSRWQGEIEGQGVGERQMLPANQDGAVSRGLSPGTMSALVESGSPSVVPSSQLTPVTRTFPVPVRNAGLVLVHSFLGHFLEHTGIREAGQKELPEGSLPRAAALLHFLATGRDEPLELELGLIKVLLGLTPASPLPVGEGLVLQPDREEAERMLQAVIDYWPILKRTSVSALRGTFLRRPGLLREDGFGWTLQVEPAPFDVLMPHLPWSISIVKLPWMRKPLYTEWPGA